jgi:hypothetical protein
MLPTLARALVTPSSTSFSCCAKPFHRIDEVGHEVGAALVLVDDLGPARLDLLVSGLDRIIAAIGEAQRRQRGQHGP